MDEKKKTAIEEVEKVIGDVLNCHPNGLVHRVMSPDEFMKLTKEFGIIKTGWAGMETNIKNLTEDLKGAKEEIELLRNQVKGVMAELQKVKDGIEPQ